jgi:hypothetical protein
MGRGIRDTGNHCAVLLLGASLGGATVDDDALLLVRVAFAAPVRQAVPQHAADELGVVQPDAQLVDRCRGPLRQAAPQPAARPAGAGNGSVQAARPVAAPAASPGAER